LRSRLFRTSAGQIRIGSLAVLPLENLSHDPEQEYFADGMTEELITDLAKISALRVISRTSVMQYKGTRKTLPEIARELGVDGIVEGSVEKLGDRVRITAQLIAAPEDRHVRAESYERDSKDVLSMQDEVARDIAGEINAALTPQERTRLARARAVNPEAHDLYLRGRYFWNQRRPESLKKSIGYFKEAVEKDPAYALAFVGLSDAYGVSSSYGIYRPTDSFPRAKDAAMKALELDDSLAEAHTSLAEVKADCDRDWQGAEREFRRAIELNPGYANAHYFYAMTSLAPRGRLDEAIAEMKKALELDPMSLIINTNLGRMYFWKRQYNKALEQYRKTLEIDPSFPVAHERIAEIYEQQGKYEAAVEEPRAPEWTVSQRASIRRAYAARGPKGYWQARLEIAKEHAKLETYLPSTSFGVIYANLGDNNAAFQWMRKAIEEHDYEADWIAVNPIYDPLRSDPRFQELLRRMNFPP
jgi:TolB-like protein/Tfp pilus assembly protein PilF